MLLLLLRLFIFFRSVGMGSSLQRLLPKVQNQTKQQNSKSENLSHIQQSLPSSKLNARCNTSCTFFLSCLPQWPLPAGEPRVYLQLFCDKRSPWTYCDLVSKSFPVAASVTRRLVIESTVIVRPIEPPFHRRSVRFRSCGARFTKWWVVAVNVESVVADWVPSVLKTSN